MRVLALDTATEACSVALLTESGISGTLRHDLRGHAEQILDLVDATLTESGLSLRDLDGIAASVGPGAFTGVRICVSVAQGLAFGADLPVVGVSTLESLALAAVQRGATQVLACLDARMGEVYWGCFGADGVRGVGSRGASAVSAPAVVHTPFAGGFTGIGRGFHAYPSLQQLAGIVVSADDREALPDARYTAQLGALRFAAGEGGDPAMLMPLYLRDKVALTEAERAARPASP